MAMKNPVHPGQIVREDCLQEFDLSVTEAAAHLGVGRAALSAVVNERASISRSLKTKIDVDRIVAA